MADNMMNPHSDATVLALHALAWTLVEPTRADRLIALTGIDPLDLRARAAEPPVQAAVLGFLESHEPDLIACAAALEVEPQVLVDARQRLEA